mmetsp:Transcript_4264/g.9179  ORF Transcript_4264/g.9179 Transcript_4264/m.9179 type:complete len:349 (+) Transcript_4264:140-1186(+)
MLVRLCAMESDVRRAPRGVFDAGGCGSVQDCSRGSSQGQCRPSSGLVHILCVLHDVLQRAQYPLERRTVNGQARDGLRGRLDVGLALVVVEERQLAEVAPGAKERRHLRLNALLGLCAHHLTRLDNEKLGTIVALLDDHIARRVGRGLEGVGQLHLLHVGERLQDRDLVKERTVLIVGALGALLHDSFEGGPVKRPRDHLSGGLDRGRARGVVEERELADEVVLALAILLGDLGRAALDVHDHVRFTRLDHVEAIALLALGHEDVTHRVHFVLERPHQRVNVDLCEVRHEEDAFYPRVQHSLVLLRLIEHGWSPALLDLHHTCHDRALAPGGPGPRYELRHFPTILVF